MSLLRSTALKNTSAGALLPTVLGSTTTAWAYGAWVELVASAAADLQVAGLALHSNTMSSSARVLLQFGIGAAAAETPVATWYWFISNNGASGASSGPEHYRLPIPMDLFPSGSRISVRIAAANNNTDLRIGLLYYEGLDSTHVLAGPIAHYPMPTSGSGGATEGRVLVVPSTTPWLDSAWVRLSPSGGWSSVVALAQLNYENNVASSLAVQPFEIDIGFGTTGSQVVKTTLASAQLARETGMPSWIDFPAVMPVPASTEVWGRIRKAGTDTWTAYLSLNFYEDWVPALVLVTQYYVEVATDEDLDDDPPVTQGPCTGGGTVDTGENPAAGTALAPAQRPLAWMELTLPDSGSPPTVYRWAGVGIPHGSPKTARVLRFEPIIRALSDLDGQPESATMAIVLSDTDLVLRGLRAAGTLRHAQVDVFVADLATLQADGTPWRVFRGLVRDGQPDRDLTFRLEVDDVFSTRLNAIDADDLQVPRQVVNEDVLGATPVEEMLDKAVPLLYGDISRTGGGWELPYIGTAVAEGHEDLGDLAWFLVSLGVVSVRAVYAGNLVFGTPTDRIQVAEALFGQTIFAPGHDGWIEANDWSERGGRRYTLVAGKPSSPAIRMAMEGRIPLVADICGYDTVGDRGASPVSTIDSPARGLLHFLNNFVVGESTGDWPALASFGDYSLFDSETFEAVHESLDGPLPDDSYLIAGAIAGDFQASAWRDRVALFCRCAGFDFGINRHGQGMLTILDRPSRLMSLLRTSVLKNTSPGAVFPAVLGSTTTAWAYGAWVQMVASAGVDLQVAGIALHSELMGASARVIFQFGIGGAGNEAAVATWYWFISDNGSSGGASGPEHYRLPIPMDLFPAGSRISVRLASANQNVDLRVGLLYYEGLDSTQVTTSPIAHYPVPTSGAGGDTEGRVLVVPSTTPWENSPWVRLSPSGGWSTMVALAQVNYENNVAFGLAVVPFEIDIGFGASGSQAVKTTLASAQLARDTGMPSWIDFPAVMRVPANTEVWGRIRKPGTDTWTAYLSLNYYDPWDTTEVAAAFTPAEILANSATVAILQVENTVRYVYERNYVSTLPQLAPQPQSRLPNDPFSGDWHSGLQTVSDDDSIDALGGDPIGVRRSEVQEYELVRDQATADAVAGERLALLSPANGRAEVRFGLSLKHGAALELGDIISVEHWDMPWTGPRRCQVRRLEWDLDALTVGVTARDVEDLLA